MLKVGLPRSGKTQNVRENDVSVGEELLSYLVLFSRMGLTIGTNNRFYVETILNYISQITEISIIEEFFGTRA